MTAGPVDPLVGTTIAGRYVVERRIGQGGMGAVYIGRQEPLGRAVAIKVLLSGLSSDLQAAERFQVEATAIARLNHPGIVTVYDYGKTDDGTLFLAMELVDGVSLRKHLDTRGRLPWPEALSIARQTASALAAAHEKGIVHRDLKPDNLMLLKGPDTDSRKAVVVKVLDFGLAKMVEGSGQQLTQASVIMGTPGYMAPEQIHGQVVDSRCDLYALGVMFWEMVVGRAPIADEAPLKVLMRHLSEEIPAPSFACREAGLPGTADQVILRLLQKDREHRPPSTSVLVDVLTRMEAEPWAAPAHLALSGNASFDVNEWDGSFSALADTGAPARAPIVSLPPTAKTAVLAAIEKAAEEPPAQSTQVMAFVDATAALPPVPQQPPPPPPAPAPPPPAAIPKMPESLFQRPSSSLPPPPSSPSPFGPPGPPSAFGPPGPPSPFGPPPSASPGNPFLPPPSSSPSRFGPPPTVLPPGLLDLDRERSKPKTIVTAPAPVKAAPVREPMSMRTQVLIGALAVGVVAVVVDLAMHRAGALGGGGGTSESADPHADDVAEAISAREQQGSRLAIDAALERVRLARETAPSQALSSTLGELLAERARLHGDLGDAEVIEARALLGSPLDARAKAALWAALGDVDAALGALQTGEGDPTDRKSRALLAELVAARDPERALTLLGDKPFVALGSRPARARAAALMAAGDVDAAIPLLDERLAGVPDDATARALRARARQLLGDTAAARADVEQALRSPLATDAALWRVRMLAADPTTKARDLDAALARLVPCAARHASAVRAARLDALRLARRDKPLAAEAAEAANDADVDVVIARSAALLALGRKPEALAAIQALEAARLPPPLATHVLALRLASSTTLAPAVAAQFAARRRASVAGALAAAVHAGGDGSAALPLLVARPLPDLDDDEALVLSALAPADPFAAVMVSRVRTGKVAAVVAFAQKKAADPRGLLLLAQHALEQGDLEKARSCLLRIEAQKDVGDDVVKAMQLLFARFLVTQGSPADARARLQPLASDAATLLAGAEVDLASSDVAAAKSKLERLRVLDRLDRGAIRKLRALP